MTKGSLIEYQALKIAELEQEIDRLRGHRNEDVEVLVHDGLKLCDWHRAQAVELKPGTGVRVNRSGNPHDPFLFARVTEVKVEEGLISVFIELEGIATYAGTVGLSKKPFASMVTKTATFIDLNQGAA